MYLDLRIIGHLVAVVVVGEYEVYLLKVHTFPRAYQEANSIILFFEIP